MATLFRSDMKFNLKWKQVKKQQTAVYLLRQRMNMKTKSRDISEHETNSYTSMISSTVAASGETTSTVPQWHIDLQNG